MCIFRKSPKSPQAEKAGKKPRIWDLGGTTKDLQTLERTTDRPEDMKSHFTPDTEVYLFFLFNFRFFNDLNFRWLAKCEVLLKI